jgi:hypothetical protein
MTRTSYHEINVSLIDYLFSFQCKLLIDYLFHSFIVVWQASNLLFVDQPVGTGFSYTSDEEDLRHDEVGVSNDLYDFLQVSLLLQLVFFKFL